MSPARPPTPILIALGLTATLATSSAHAEEGDELVWKEQWPRVRPAEYVTTGLLAAGLVAALAMPQLEGTWTGGVLSRAPKTASSSATSETASTGG
jgi:hypothetical protein